jgi:outer membrane protein
MSGMKKKIVTGIITLFALASFAQEKSVSSYSLKEAVDYALKNNNDAKNAKLDMVKAKAYNWEILTTGLPQVNGSFEYDYYFKTPIVPAFTDELGPLFKQFGVNPSNISFVLPNNITTGISVSQLLFDARYVFGVKARKELYLTSRLQSNLSDQDIKYNVTKAYCQAEAAQEAKSLLLDNQKIVDKILSDTRAVFAQGLTEELDVNRLELVQANLQSQINQQNNMAEVALANLKFQMGLSLDEVIILKDKLDDLRNTIVPEQNKFDYKNRVEYELLTTGITLQGYNMQAKRSGYYPTLAGFLNYTGNVQTTGFSDMFNKSNWFQQGLIGLKVNVPLFDSGLKRAQYKQAEVDQLKLKNNLENFKNAAQLQYESSLSTYNAALADEVIAQKTLDLSQKIYNTNQIKFKNGGGSSFELEQSEQDYATNILKHTQSIMNLLTAKADLDKAMGVK